VAYLKKIDSVNMLLMFLIFYAFLDHEIEIHLYFSSKKKA